MRITRRRLLALLAASSSSLIGPRVAMSAPPIKMIVGFRPGGTADTIARAVAEGLRTSGYACVVENRPGASGRLAFDALLRAPADGTTFLMTPSPNLTLFPHIYSDLKYGPGDLSIIGTAAEVQMGLAVSKEAGPATLAQFLEQARKDPTRGFYGTPGTGSVMQLLGSVLAQRSQAPLSNVPYKGGSESLNDVISGTVPAAITALPNLIPMHQAGRLRILAVTADKRLPAIPDVPTFASLGYPEMTASEYMCLVTRKGGQAQVLDPLTAAFAAAVNAPATLAVIEKTGFERSSSTGQAATLARLTADSTRWQAAVKSSGFRAVE